MSVTKLLAPRAARTHRKAWATVFAALALTSLLLARWTPSGFRRPRRTDR